MTLSNFDKEIEQGLRFKFGNNWKMYLTNLSDEKVKIAEQSILQMLDLKDFKGLNLLDIGCGSGLFSMAAVNLGANVYSFDFDPDSVKCTQYLKKKYHKNTSWHISEASVLDHKHLHGIGKFDIVYSWGVLHHTGNLNLALENVLIPLKVGGTLFIGIYNDQGKKTIVWKRIKKLYNKNIAYKLAIRFTFISYYMFRLAFFDLVRFRNPLLRYKAYQKNRGMSMWYDWYDWLGGYPFEAAKPEDIINYYEKKGLELRKLKTTTTAGINEFVFVRTN